MIEQEFRESDGWKVEGMGFLDKWSGIRVFKKEWKESGVTYKIENDKENWNCLSYGIINIEKKIDIDCRLINKDNSWSNSQKWPCYKFFSDDLRKTWVDVFRIAIFKEESRNRVAGQIAGIFIKFIDETKSIFNEKIVNQNS